MRACVRRRRPQASRAVAASPASSSFVGCCAQCTHGSPARARSRARALFFSVARVCLDLHARCTEKKTQTANSAPLVSSSESKSEKPKQGYNKTSARSQPGPPRHDTIQTHNPRTHGRKKNCCAVDCFLFAVNARSLLLLRPKNLLRRRALTRSAVLCMLGKD